MSKDLSKSSSSLNEVIYGGRPKGEEPHVKKSVKKKEERTEYILRVDLDELKIGDDDFENLQSVFKLFDLDKDGILNFKEYEKLLRCLGYRLNEKQSRDLAKSVSVDKTNLSVSFNEFLKLMSMQKSSEPDSTVLLDVFASMDTEKSGKISEKCFRKVMLGNEGVHPRDVEEMLEEYYRIAKLKNISTEPPIRFQEGHKSNFKNVQKGSNHNDPYDKWIDYKEFATMLQS